MKSDLETVVSERRPIAMCCGAPMVWTMIFTGAEWYCTKCKGNYGCLDVESVPGTLELEQTQNEVQAEFNELRKDCLPYGAYITGCENCNDRNECHLLHATEEELARSEAAYKALRAR